MITDLLFQILGGLLNGIASILPAWGVWPQTLIDGLNYFFQSLAKFNFILPVDQLLLILLWFVHFTALYFGAKLALKGINFLRGTGTGLDIK